MDLITVGDVMVDVHVESPSLKRGGDVHGHVQLQPAGTSANAAVWAAREGASVRVHGRVGDDLAGRLLAGALRDHGVDPALVFDEDEATGTMLVVVEAGERSMVADRGANARLVSDDLPAALIAGAVLVSGYLLQQEPTTPVALEALARSRATFTAVEAASWPLVEAFGAEAFVDRTTAAGADTAFANGREAKILTGADGREAAARLGEHYRLACVKLGAAGAVMSLDGSILEMDLGTVEEVDPTGAGDAFDGVLLAALVSGVDPEEALRRACRAGAIVSGTATTWPEEGGR